MSKDLLYEIALTLIPGIGPVQARLLLSHFNPREIFTTKRTTLEKIEGIGSIRADNIKRFNSFDKAESELRFIEKANIKTLFVTAGDYPKRLLNCYDSPTLLYYKGETDLNASRMISIIGTRHNTPYGKQLTEQLVAGLAGYGVSVISGLAYGIDALAHQSALRHALPTIGVLAHGLEQVYPAQHFGLAGKMINEGGALLTEFASGTQPDRHNFPLRNRIVAGLSDAVVVIETGIKGGSMITAELANGYNRDVFAFPGRITDPKSAGCHELVKSNKATLLTEAADMVRLMGWAGREANQQQGFNRQKKLFVELSAEERIIVDLLQRIEKMHIDEINFQSGLSATTIAAAMLNLELLQVVRVQPGNLYSLQ